MITLGEETRKTKNGIPVYICENRALHGFCLSMYVRAGAIYEKEANEGTAHFLEHVAVRNLNAVRGGTLYAELDRYGLELSASTYREMIWFYIVGEARHAARAAAILAGLLSPIVLSAEEIAPERGRIKAEIRETDERDTLAYFAAKTLYPGSPLANSIIGNAASVGAVTVRKLESYRRLAMSEGNVFFVATGNLSGDAIETLIGEAEKYPLYPGAVRDLSITKPARFCDRGGAVFVKNADYTVLRFQFDLDMKKVGVPDTDMLYDVLFTGNNSLFFSELSERRGLCYDVTGAVERYLNVGIFSFTVETKNRDLYDVAALSVALLQKIKTDLLPQDAMPYAPYSDNVGLLADDCVETNFTFGYESHILGLGYRSLAERERAYLAVTPEKLRQTARAVFTPANLALTLKGDKRAVDTQKLALILSEL